MACTCPEGITTLAELCDECQQVLQEDMPTPIEVDERGILEEETYGNNGST